MNNNDRLRTQVGYPPHQQLRAGGQIVVPLGGTAAPTQASQPGALGTEQGVFVRLPGADFPPAGAIPVDAIGDADIAPAGAAVLVTAVVPENLRLRISGIGFGADDEVALGFLTWVPQSDGAAAPGLQQIFAAVGSIRQLANIFMVFGSSATVTVVANIDATAALTYRYICRISGWLYNEQEAV